MQDTLKLSNLTTTRRRALASAAGLLMGAPSILAAQPSTDIKVVEMETTFEDFHYRTPIKFGGSIVDRVTLLNVKCTVRVRQGKIAHGFGGSMPLGKHLVFPFETAHLRSNARRDESIGGAD